MRGSNAIPKPNKVGRNKPVFDWQKLPKSGNPLAPPPLPGDGMWDSNDEMRWESLWKTPQSTMWDRTFHPQVARWLWLQQKVWNDQASGGVLSELRQIENNLGLNPRALLALRWVIVDDDLADTEPSNAPVIELVQKPKSARIDPREEG